MRLDEAVKQVLLEDPSMRKQNKILSNITIDIRNLQKIVKDLIDVNYNLNTSSLKSLDNLATSLDKAEKDIRGI